LRNEEKFVVRFATSNVNKVEEVVSILEDYLIRIEQVNAKTMEIQADNVEDIAKTSAIWAAQESKSPVFVEDTGLFVKALEGFPGPYAAYVYKTIGRKGILKLLSGVSDRRAEFRSVVAFCAPGGEAVCFLGIVSGMISAEERGSWGFGFDSIFKPDGGGGRTFAEMPIDEKNRYSHRAQSVRKFADWYLKSFRGP